MRIFPSSNGYAIMFLIGRAKEVPLAGGQNGQDYDFFAAIAILGRNRVLALIL
jgi:hypothetical protein